MATRNYSLDIIRVDSCSTCRTQAVVQTLAPGDTLKYSFTHDANSRMLTKGTQQSYVFDALNRMTQVTGKESYVYDGHGRRVQITKTSDGKLNYPIYSLDGKLLLEDNRQTLKRTEYIYAGGRLVAKIIQPITAAGANNGTATTTTIHSDFLGSPVAETNSAGTVTRVERYTPYGEPADMQLDVGPGFTGHATDVATGLTYMQQRYFDAELGRFISPDPVGPEEDFIKHFNRYNYALNNPVRYTDPDGRESSFTDWLVKMVSNNASDSAHDSLAQQQIRYSIKTVNDKIEKTEKTVDGKIGTVLDHVRVVAIVEAGKGVAASGQYTLLGTERNKKSNISGGIGEGKAAAVVVQVLLPKFKLFPNSEDNAPAGMSYEVGGGEELFGTAGIDVSPTGYVQITIGVGYGFGKLERYGPSLTGEIP